MIKNAKIISPSYDMRVCDSQNGSTVTNDTQIMIKLYYLTLENIFGKIT